MVSLNSKNFIMLNAKSAVNPNEVPGVLFSYLDTREGVESEERDTFHCMMSKEAVKQVATAMSAVSSSGETEIYNATLELDKNGRKRPINTEVKIYPVFDKSVCTIELIIGGVKYKINEIDIEECREFGQRDLQMKEYL